MTEKMNGICLINQVWSRMLPYTSQIAEEASFFQLSLPFTSYLTQLFSSFQDVFRARFFDSQSSKINFNLLEILETLKDYTHPMLVKLQAFIP